MFTPDDDTRTGLIPEWLRLKAMTAYLAAIYPDASPELLKERASTLLRLATITYEDN